MNRLDGAFLDDSSRSNNAHLSGRFDLDINQCYHRRYLIPLSAVGLSFGSCQACTGSSDLSSVCVLLLQSVTQLIGPQLTSSKMSSSYPPLLSNLNFLRSRHKKVLDLELVALGDVKLLSDYERTRI